MARSPKKKIGGADGISLGGQVEKNFSLSIGEMLGRESPASENANQKTGENPAPAKKPATENPQPVKEAILRKESAGRGGRTVTVVEPRPAPAAPELENLAKAMRKGLGCGSHVEGAKIILQGDIRDRAAAWLTKQGVKKIVRGN